MVKTSTSASDNNSGYEVSKSSKGRYHPHRVLVAIALNSIKALKINVNMINMIHDMINFDFT